LEIFFSKLKFSIHFNLYFFSKKFTKKPIFNSNISHFSLDCKYKAIISPIKIGNKILVLFFKYKSHILSKSSNQTFHIKRKEKSPHFFK